MTPIEYFFKKYYSLFKDENTPMKYTSCWSNG